MTPIGGTGAYRRHLPAPEERESDVAALRSKWSAIANSRVPCAQARPIGLSLTL
jgi:hypothetical protein